MYHLKSHTKYLTHPQKICCLFRRKNLGVSDWFTSSCFLNTPWCTGQPVYAFLSRHVRRDPCKFKFKILLIELVQRQVSLTTRKYNTQQKSNLQYTQSCKLIVNFLLQISINTLVLLNICAFATLLIIFASEAVDISNILTPISYIIWWALQINDILQVGSSHHYSLNQDCGKVHYRGICPVRKWIEDILG